jgi:ATP-binding protein involved in chromosome partitioning
MPLTENEILAQLRTIKYPGFSRDIVSFGIVKHIGIQGERCQIALELTASDPKLGDQIRTEVEQKLKACGVSDPQVTLNFKAAAPTHAGQTGQQVQGIRHSIAVASGKGGVGKSTVSVNLALSLSKLGSKVGLLDCDIYGPSIPLMMNVVHAQPTVEGERLIPLSNHGIKLMSMGFLVDPNSPVVWRGPMITRTIQQFVHQVDWGELDYLVIDLPPGTGDAQLSLCQTIPLTGAVIVTTPQEVALIDVRKSVGMFQKVNVPILGIVENMSYFLCPSDNKRYDIFGSGGGQSEADRLGVPLFGQIPIEMAVREGGDAGAPVVIKNPESAASQAFLDTARSIRQKLP